MTMNFNRTAGIITECVRVSMFLYVCVCVGYLAFVVCGGDVHLLLDHVVDVGGGAALDPFLLLSLQLVSHHLDGLCPLISDCKTYNTIKFREAVIAKPTVPHPLLLTHIMV